MHRTPWTAPDPVVAQANDRAWFRGVVGQAVAPPSTTLLVVWVVSLVFAVTGLFTRMIYAAVESHEPYSYYSSVRRQPEFWEAFFSTERYGQTNGWLVVLLWLPVLLLVVAVVAFVAQRQTRRMKIDLAYGRFTSSGYVALALPLPLQLMRPDGPATVQLLMPDKLGTPDAFAWYDGLCRRLTVDAGLRFHLLGQVSTTLARTEDAVSVEAFLPDPPTFSLFVVAPMRFGPASVRVVVPDEQGDPKAYLVPPQVMTRF